MRRSLQHGDSCLFVPSAWTNPAETTLCAMRANLLNRHPRVTQPHLREATTGGVKGLLGSQQPQACSVHHLTGEAIATIGRPSLHTP